MKKPMTGDDAIQRIRDHFTAYGEKYTNHRPLLDEAVRMSITAIKDMERVNALGGIESFECALDIVNLLNVDAIKLVCAQNRAYKKLGTVEELETLLSHIQELNNKLARYICVGTVDEVHAAVAKTKPHKIIVGDDKYSGHCPCCGNKLNTTFMDSNYCHWCGNKLTEFDEEVSDEFEERAKKIADINDISIKQAACWLVNYTDRQASICQHHCANVDRCRNIHEIKEEK